MIKNRALRRSLTDFSRHPWLHLMSIATVAVSLLILGGFLLFYRNVENVAEKTNPQMTGTLYLKEGMTESEIKRLREKILLLESVATVTYKNKQSVVNELQAFLGDAGSDTIPGSELFPDILEIQVANGLGMQILGTLKGQLEKYPEVVEADFSEDWLVQYKKIRHFLKLAGFVLLVSLVIGCSFIIANFMGMRHQSRRGEIEIVRLIGAHQNFILTPFLWEGIIEGIMGAVVALFLLLITKGVVATFITVQWSSILGIRNWLFLSLQQVIILVGVGIVMALLGSVTVFARLNEDSRT